MDENKRLKLIKIDYTIEQCCGVCAHGKFKPNNDFGDCQLHAYQHLKHSTDVRDLSVYRYGSCPYFELREGVKEFIHGFAEFLRK